MLDLLVPPIPADAAATTSTRYENAVQGVFCMVLFIVMQASVMSASPMLDVIVLPTAGMYVGWHCTRPERCGMACVTVPMGVASTALCSILASMTTATLDLSTTIMSTTTMLLYAPPLDVVPYRHVLYTSEKCLQTLCMGVMSFYMGGHILRRDNVLRVLLFTAMQVLLCAMMAVMQDGRGILCAWGFVSLTGTIASHL